MSAGVARPILMRLIDDVGRAAHAVGDPRVVHVDHHGRNRRAGVGRGDPRPHLTRPQHADPVHGTRL